MSMVVVPEFQWLPRYVHLNSDLPTPKSGQVPKRNFDHGGVMKALKGPNAPTLRDKVVCLH